MNLSRIRAYVKNETRSVGVELWSEGRGWILVVVSLGWFLSMGVRMIFSALLPAIQSTFDLSLTAAGALITVLWFAYALGQFPGGILGDRIGERNILVLSSVLAGTAIFVVTIAGNVGLFFLGTIVFGVATALYAPIRFTILSDIYPTRDATAIGITLAAGNVGNAVLPVLAGLIAVYLTFRAGFAFVVPLFFLTAIALWVIVPISTGSETSAVDTLTVSSMYRIVQGVTNRPVLLISAQLLLLVFVWQAFAGFYPTYLIVEKGLKSSTAAWLFGLYFATGIVIQPLSGALSDRIGPKRALYLVITTIIVSLVALTILTSLMGLIIVTVSLGSILGVGTIASTFLVNSLPEDMRGSGIGLIRSGYMMVASTGPLFVGAMADIGLFNEAFLILAGVATVGIILCALLPSQ